MLTVDVGVTLSLDDTSFVDNVSVIWDRDGVVVCHICAGVVVVVKVSDDERSDVAAAADDNDGKPD